MLLRTTTSLLRPREGHRAPLRPGAPRSGCLGVQLSDLVEPAGLRYAFVCNYMVDVHFLASECPALLDCPKVLLLHGLRSSAEHQQVAVWRPPRNPAHSAPLSHRPPVAEP